MRRSSVWIRSIGVVAAIVLPLLHAVGCASAPGPGDAGYPHNVDGAYTGVLEIEGRNHGAEMTLRLEAGGIVTGSLTTDPPSPWTGDVSGAVDGDVFHWRSAWVAPEDGCSGAVRGRGTIEPGGGRIEGLLRVVAACAAPAQGSFLLRRATSAPPSP